MSNSLIISQKKDPSRFYTSLRESKLPNEKILNICDNYRPNIIVLGHNNILEGSSINTIKKKYSSKFTLWYEDALGKRGEGPNWKSNLNLIEKL